MLIFACALVIPTLAADITLIGTCPVSANEIDKSGLEGNIGANIPANRLGGWGSAIASTRASDRFILLADRGPGDGAAAFPCRVHEARIVIDPAASPAVRFELLSTHLLLDERGRRFMGSSGAYDTADQAAGLRLDPEGVRVSPTGTLWMSDEYGPWIDEFSAGGKHLRRIAPPEAYRVKVPDGDPANELPPANTSGRQGNRGFEGLAISPDGETLWAIPQSPLIQDGAVDGRNKRIGLNIRILELNLRSGATRQLVYQLDTHGNGVSEILAIDDHRLLVIERDGGEGAKAEEKRIVRIDTRGATDVSAVAALPSRSLPPEIVPVTKKEFIDLLEPRFRLAGSEFPEKVEGLAFGPDQADGSRTLLVATDNDFRDGVPSWIWVFRVPAAQLAEAASDRVRP
jgi:hypothetical protein